MREIIPYQEGQSPDLSNEEKTYRFLAAVFAATGNDADDPAAALLPWVCDRLLSAHSREAYGRDLRDFARQMKALGVDPLAVTGDHVRMYKAALFQAGKKKSSVARTLSAIRGTYRELAKRGFVEWTRAQDIQAVEAPQPERNITPQLSEREAIKLLHAPDLSTLKGLRDHALLFVFLRTTARVSAIVKAKVGHLERSDTDYYLRVNEKGNKWERKILLDASPALLRYLKEAGIEGDLEGPLFRPFDKDRKTLLRKTLTRRMMLNLVKEHGRKAGIDVDRLDGPGVGVHSLRKTAANNAIEHGAPIQYVQRLMGHADIRTTQDYIQASEKDAEKAARYIQIR